MKVTLDAEQLAEAIAAGEARQRSAEAKQSRPAVKGDTVNGGWFHGMPLGGITKTDDGYEVYC